MPTLLYQTGKQVLPLRTSWQNVRNIFVNHRYIDHSYKLKKNEREHAKLPLR